MISLDQALAAVLARTPRLPAHPVPCTESGGSWLQEVVHSDVDLPPADVSAMDGYAVRAADVAGAPVDLDVVGEIAAGVQPDFRIDAGQAARIMTGASLPEGADAVQMVECTEPGEHRVRVLEPVGPGRHVRRRGENLGRGEELLAPGQRIGPAEVGLLAGAGKVLVSVCRRPRVALVATGDELVEPGALPAPGQIRNTNGYSLYQQVDDDNGVPVYLGIARDEPQSLDQMISMGLEHDVLLLAGGVSMGVYDLVTAALERAGVSIVFEKVAVKPGKPTVFGYREGPEGTTLVFGLPGNPVSGMVIFRLLVGPALRQMQGAPHPVERGAQARLSADLAATAGREAFHPARIRWQGSGFEAHPVAHRGSGDLVAWRQANGLIRLPAGQGAASGEVVDVMLARDYELR